MVMNAKCFSVSMVLFGVIAGLGGIAGGGLLDAHSMQSQSHSAAFEEVETRSG
jgi:hypothetical protein